MTKFEKFFADSRLMMTAFVIAFAAYIVSSVLSFIPINGFVTDISDSAITVATAVLLLLLFLSFRKHETALMHISTGALFITFILGSITFVISALTNLSDIPALIACPLVEEALCIILFINHMTINTSHGPTRGRVVLNQVISVIICAYELFLVVMYIITAVQHPEAALPMTGYIAAALGKMFAFNLLVCIETKLNTYKILREAFSKNGAWSEGMKQTAKDDVFGK